MDTQGLKAWAEHHGEGAVNDCRDMALSLTSKLLRFRWQGAPSVGIGSEAVGKTRINAVLDGVAWFLATAEPGDDTLHIILGTREGTSKIKEHVDAIGTVATEVRDGPTIRVWRVGSSGDPIKIETTPASFTTTTPERWASMLGQAADCAVSGLAADLVSAVAHPSFALYPKLSSQAAAQPWQLRLDGLEIGRAGASTAMLHLKSRDLDKPREPRTTWKKVVGPNAIPFDANSLTPTVARIKELIAAWTDTAHLGGVLRHGQAEHALEAFVLSGRLSLVTSGGALRLAVPYEAGTLRAAQFPTLWGNVTAPSRYLDALLADTHGRPWAIELKDQDAGGGHGAYLRHGIGQAVLYRHYIRSVSELDPWFERYGLKRAQCEAAVAFPTGASAAAATVDRHRDLARRCGVEVIEFPRPGSFT